MGIPTKVQEGNPWYPFERSKFCADIDTLASEFGRVNNSNAITSEFKFKVNDHPSLVHFVPFYRQLSQIVRKKSLHNPLASTSSIITTPPVQPTVPLNSLQTPPPRTVNPMNPQYSSTSTTSTSSRESKPEHFTHAFANGFVSAALHSLEDNIEQLAWYRSAKYELEHW